MLQAFHHVGIKQIDDDHQELFARMEKLLTDCIQGRGAHEVMRMLDFLDEYVVTHFSTEEELQRQYEYLEYFEHRGQHVQLIRNLEFLKQEAREKGINDNLVIQINQMLIEWFRIHILESDRRMCDHLKMKMR